MTGQKSEALPNKIWKFYPIHFFKWKQNYLFAILNLPSNCYHRVTKNGAFYKSYGRSRVTSFMEGSRAAEMLAQTPSGALSDPCKGQLMGGLPSFVYSPLFSKLLSLLVFYPKSTTKLHPNYLIIIFTTINQTKYSTPVHQLVSKIQITMKAVLTGQKSERQNSLKMKRTQVFKEVMYCDLQGQLSR